MKKHFRYLLYLYVFTGYLVAIAGAYDDFFRAVRQDDTATVSALLQRGFDVNSPDPQSRNALGLALTEPSPRVLQVLLDWPATRIDQRNENDETPLMIAALRGNLPAAQGLLARGADVNKTGWTPLHYAATRGDPALMRLLLEHHAYIDAESPNGSTPLMMAARYGTRDAVQLLLDAGADPLLKNQLQLSARDFAKGASRDEIAALIGAAISALPERTQPLGPGTRPSP